MKANYKNKFLRKKQNQLNLLNSFKRNLIEGDFIMENMFKKISQFANKAWKKIKKAAITVKIASVYFMEGFVKSLVGSLCILAGVNVRTK